MNARVPALSMAFMALTMVCCFAGPIVLLIRYKRKGADLAPFFVGCGVFVLFALVLEAALHNLILKGLPVGERIQGNTLLFALYGGLMAGLFEETGRFVAFRTVLKKRLGNDRNALMYGTGHGGVEAMLLVGFAYISNLLMAALLNLGMTDTVTAGLTGAAGEQVKAALDTLVTTSPWTYLLALAERAVAVTAHICFSVLVWFAAKKPGKLWLFPLAILLHAALDGFTMVLASKLSLVAVEGCLAVMAALLVLLARTVWKRNAAA